MESEILAGDIKDWEFSTVQTSDQVELQVGCLGDPYKAKATVVFVHGVGSHMRRHAHVADLLVKNSFFFVSFDQRGHGMSGGGRGVIPTDTQLLEDISQIIALARAKNPDLPIFLYGHSMGGLEVLDYAISKQPDLRGVIATSPALDLSGTSAFKRLLAKLLAPILPNLQVASGLEQAALSRDDEVVRKYQQDPLIHDKVSVRLGSYMTTAAARVLERAAEWNLPLYLAHGSADRICRVAGSDAFAAKVQVPITYKRWDGLYHETHNEPEKAEVLGSMLAWMLAQV